ncbi:MAG: hypothetical protein WCL19_09580, partial [Verrucomicrobiota bacterium]
RLKTLVTRPKTLVARLKTRVARLKTRVARPKKTGVAAIFELYGAVGAAYEWCHLRGKKPKNPAPMASPGTL